MKKLLLLLLLPACLLGQEEKSRKLYLEIKQGVGLPSIGIKYKNQKGNYWNVGVNTIDYMPSVFNKNGYKFYRIGPYFSFTKKIEYKFTSDFGLQTVILDDGDDAYTFLSAFTGLYYGNKISIGLDLTTPILFGKVYFLCAPSIKFKL